MLHERPPQPHGFAIAQSVGHLLRYMADRYDLLVLTTGHMVGGDTHAAKRPALRNFWSSQPHQRVELSVDDAEARPEDLSFRRARLVMNAVGPAGKEARLKITNAGFEART